MNLQLHLEAFAGSDILPTAIEMIRIADMLDVTTMLDFNGVTLMACPGYHANRLVNAYHEELSSEKRIKIARGR